MTIMKNNGTDKQYLTTTTTTTILLNCEYSKMNKKTKK